MVRRKFKRGTKPEWQKNIGKERIQILMDLAGEEVRTHPERSRRYVEIARKIGLRYRIRLPQTFKRRICKHCNMYLAPGVTSRVRLKDGTKVITCLDCGKTKRYPYRE